MVNCVNAFASSGCAAASWNPEVYTFYGAKANIVENISHIPVTLSERRVFVQITEDSSGVAEVKFYEKESGDTYTVRQWRTKDVAALLAEIDNAIFENKGVNCVGEQVKAILKRHLENETILTAVPAPESPKAAFTHSVNEATGDFIRTTIMVLC
ncbi:MAG: hypothetical protein ACLQU4_09745 [Limisphaerales bacterium]